MPNQSRGLHNDQWVAGVNRTNNRTISVLKLLFVCNVAGCQCRGRGHTGGGCRMVRRQSRNAEYSGWHEATRDNQGATVYSGRIILHVMQGPDREWLVDSAKLCT
jgi:hypothetical protein